MSTETTGAPLVHEALFYTEPEELLAGIASFVAAGADAGEPVLALLSSSKIPEVRAALDSCADSVELAAMDVVGRNPARIIPTVRDFVSRHADAPRHRFVGEPIWASRSDAELEECHRHESLLNVAFAGGPPLSILCPYDATALAPAVLAHARSTHPVLVEGEIRSDSADYHPCAPGWGSLDDPLPAPPADAYVLAFDGQSLGALRRAVADRAASAGIGADRVSGLVAAAGELAGNSVTHGGGRGVLRIWPDDAGVVCQIEDGGHLTDPLAGRARADTNATSGRGLWIVNHLCDLVQLRSSPTGTVVRVHSRCL